jgi:hypothetical protein
MAAHFMNGGLGLHRTVIAQVNCRVAGHRGTNPPPNNRRADRIKHSWITLCEEPENPGQASPPQSNLNDQLAVLLELRINRDQMQRLADGLSDQQAVKGVGVIERQVGHQYGVS